MTSKNRNGHLGSICDENSIAVDLSKNVSERRKKWLYDFAFPTKLLFPIVGVSRTCCLVKTAKATKESHQIKHLMLRLANAGQVTSPF